MTVKRLIEKLNREDFLNLQIMVCDEYDDFASNFNITYNNSTVFLERVDLESHLNPKIVNLDE